MREDEFNRRRAAEERSKADQAASSASRQKYLEIAAIFESRLVEGKPGAAK